MFGTQEKIRCAIVALAISIALQWGGLLQGVDHFLSDTRMQMSQRPVTGDIVFIAIDKKSLDTEQVWPWPRSVHAKLIDRLIEADVTDIAFDIDFSNLSEPSEDKAFSDALDRAGGAVVLPTFLQQGSARAGDASLVQSSPVEQFSQRAWMASVNVRPDRDGVVRHYARADRVAGEWIASMAVMLSGDGRMDGSRYLVDFSIDPATIPIFSYMDVLHNKVPAEELRNKIALVGAHALELRDTMPVPVYGIVPGPVLQILAAETISQARELRPVKIAVTLMLAAIAVGLLMIIWPRIHLRTHVLALIGLSAVFECMAFYLQSQHALILASAHVHAIFLLTMIIRIAEELDVKGSLLKLAGFEARNTRKILDQIFNDSSDAILIMDDAGQIIDQNRRYVNLFGKFSSVPDQKKTHAHVPGQLEHDAGLAIQAMKCGASLDTRFGNLVLTHDGQQVFIEYTVTPSVVDHQNKTDGSANGALYLATITARDVSVETLQKRQLLHLSKYDELTGTERRGEFVDQLSQETNTYGLTTLLAVGILRFSSFTSSMGREVGDELLKAMAVRLRRVDRRIVGVSRIDVNGFAIRLGEGVDEAGAQELIEILLAKLLEPYQLLSQQITVDVCIGMASFDLRSSVDAGLLVDRVEFALEEAEKIGPGGVCQFDSKLNAKRQRARLLEQELHFALRAGQLHVVYQPQVSALDGSPTGAEALLRWTHPEYGVVSPYEFMEIAETNGQIIEFGQMVLHKACRDALNWPDDVSVSVNVSPVQLTRGDIVHDVRKALEETGLPPQRLVLEITESGFVSAADQIILQLRLIKAMGVSIVLDDFGTGFSSLGYFSKFPLDKIKVDQSFVRDIADKPAHQAILQSIKVLAQGLGIKVLCEGVETRSELGYVRKFGCDEIQGYLFGKPMSVTDINRFMTPQDSVEVA